MITLEEAEVIRDEQLKKLSKSYKTEVIQSNFREFELGWILYFKTKDPNKDRELFQAGVIVIDKNDGSTTPIHLHIIQSESGITIEELYKQDKYNIPIENEKERIENFFKGIKDNSSKELATLLKLQQERELCKQKSFFYKIFSSIKNYLDS